MVSIMQLKNGQYIMTVPSIIIKAMSLKKRDQIQYQFEGGQVVIKKVVPFIVTK